MSDFWLAGSSPAPAAALLLGASGSLSSCSPCDTVSAGLPLGAAREGAHLRLPARAKRPRNMAASGLVSATLAASGDWESGRPRPSRPRRGRTKLGPACDFLGISVRKPREYLISRVNVCRLPELISLYYFVKVSCDFGRDD